jgi:REP element-mobilizing transposase RayT
MKKCSYNCLLHTIFEVDEREAFIAPEWENSLSKIISETMDDYGYTCLIVKGMPDHIHLLYQHHENVEFLHELLKNVKKKTTKWINKQLKKGCFLWKASSPIFTLDDFTGGQYYEKISMQKEIHKHYTFFEEYKMIIEDNLLLDV